MFGKIVSSFVNDVIMPPIGLVVGKVDFSSLYLNLSSSTYASLAEAQKAGAPVIKYGLLKLPAVSCRESSILKEHYLF